LAQGGTITATPPSRSLALARGRRNWRGGGRPAMAWRFQITSTRNQTVKDLLKLRLKRKARLGQNLALVRGRRLVQSIGELLPFHRVYTHEEPAKWSGYNAERIVSVDRPVLEHIIFGPSREEYKGRLDDDEFVIGTVEQPKPVDDFPDGARRLLALDGISNPENMGMLLSSAVALKFDGVVLAGPCVDPFSYKVLEASQAVGWLLPYHYANAAEILALCQRHCLEPCAADARGVRLPELPRRPAGTRGFCLTVGSESRGVHPDLLAGCTRIALPMSELTESLNAGVAGGILMHALSCAWSGPPG